MGATQLPPVGWYPDPAGRASFRYWDSQSWAAGPPQPTPRERRDTARATSLMVLAVGVAGLFGLWSMFAMMIPTDGCTAEKCTEALVGIAYIVLWLGLPIAVIGGLVGIGNAAKRKRPKAIPALVSLIAVVALIVAWFVLMRAGTPSSMW